MTISIAHLGPPGTYTEAAALAYADRLRQTSGQEALLCPCPSIAQTLRSLAAQEVNLAVVPVENSIHGSVAVTLDSLWELDKLKIQQALVLPITHVLISRGGSLEKLKTVYSHPQALGQCQQWLEKFLPKVQLVAANSTTEALKHLDTDVTAGAIASQRAAELYNLPILATDLNDYPDNCTRFWVVGLQPSSCGSHIALAFSTPTNTPGALMNPLQIFAQRGINLSRIESRPTKRLLGEYIFFIELEGDMTQASVQDSLADLSDHTAVLKIFGNYDVLPLK